MTSIQTHLAAAGMAAARRRRGPGMTIMMVTPEVVDWGPGGTSPKIRCRPTARRVCCGPSISTARSTVSVSDEDSLAARILAAVKSRLSRLCDRSSEDEAQHQQRGASTRPAPAAEGVQGRRQVQRPPDHRPGLHQVQHHRGSTDVRLPRVLPGLQADHERRLHLLRLHCTSGPGAEPREGGAGVPEARCPRAAGRRL